jgi:hypothetical protein
MPDFDVHLLNDLFREILTPQDTQDDAKQFRTGGDIQPLERGLIPLRDGGQ